MCRVVGSVCALPAEQRSCFIDHVAVTRATPMGHLWAEQKAVGAICISIPFLLWNTDNYYFVFSFGMVLCTTPLTFFTPFGTLEAEKKWSKRDCRFQHRRAHETDRADG